MKKIALLTLGLMTWMGMSAESLYTRNQTTEFYDYVGEEVDAKFAVDFGDLQSTDVAYTEGTIHDSKAIIDFQKLGLYKFCYLASRSTPNKAETFAPILWNNNSGDDGKNNEVSESHRPAVYFPKFKTGINKLIVSGWAASSANMFVLTKDSKGAWVGLTNVAPEASKGTINLSTTKYVYDTLVINNANVKELMINRNGGGYFFLVNVEIIPIGHEDDLVPATKFRIDPTSANMEVSQTLQINHKVTPFNSTDPIAYTSLDDTKATVSDKGLVKAVGAGNTQIVVTCGDLSDTLSLSIIGETPVTSIELDKHEMEIAEGKYDRLTATVLPVDASKPDVTWISRDTNVVKVDGGLLRGVVEGVTYVVAQAGEKLDSCKVTVFWEMPEATDYLLVEYYPGCFYYEWYGDDQTEPVTIDFTKWNYDSLPDPAWPDFKTITSMGHTDALQQRYNIGFYQWTIYENRDLSSDGYSQGSSSKANVLFNEGYTYLDGVKTGAGAVPQSKRPALYFPHYKNGIKQIRITGVSHTNNRAMFIGYKTTVQGSEGQDSTILAGLPGVTFENVWDEYVVDMSNSVISDVRISRNSTDYWFIGSIEVIPHDASALPIVQDDRYEARAVTGGILINAKVDVNVDIFSITGVKLHTVFVKAGVHTMIPMPMGVYVVNNDKVIVSR